LPFPSHIFWDSDVDKWLEAVCYSLESQDDADLDANIKGLAEITTIASQRDG
jgi:DUF1680 family protein